MIMFIQISLNPGRNFIQSSLSFPVYNMKGMNEKVFIRPFDQKSFIRKGAVEKVFKNSVHESGQVVGWLEGCPIHQKVVGSIPGQGIYWGGGNWLMFLSLFLSPSPYPSLSPYPPHLFLSLKSVRTYPWERIRKKVGTWEPGGGEEVITLLFTCSRALRGREADVTISENLRDWNEKKTWR